MRVYVDHAWRYPASLRVDYLRVLYLSRCAAAYLNNFAVSEIDTAPSRRWLPVSTVALVINVGLCAGAS